jgi:membrane protease YdiL (CAAX protease family)
MKRARVQDATGRPMSPIAAAMWTFAASLLEQLFVATTEALRPGGLTDVINVTACDVLATSIAVLVVLRVHAPDLPLRTALALRPCSPVDLLASAAAGAGLSPALSALDDVILRTWPYDDAAALENVDKLVSHASRTALVVGIFVVIPLARELFFRGILFGRLRTSVSTRMAISMTAVLFACSSLDWRAMPSALLLGLVLGGLRGGTGTVVAPIVAHLSFWAVEGIPILRGRDPTADVTYPAPWAAAGAAVGLLALGIAFRRDRSDGMAADG